MKGVFLDTSGWFAALSPKEHLHAASRTAYVEWMSRGIRLVTTNLVLAEMHILINRSRGGGEAVRFLDSVYQDPHHDVLFSDRDLERAAADRWLRGSREGMGVSLCDAVSFEAMRAHGLRTALALDVHFAAAGYECVPLPQKRSQRRARGPSR